MYSISARLLRISKIATELEGRFERNQHPMIYFNMHFSNGKKNLGGMSWCIENGQDSEKEYANLYALCEILGVFDPEDLHDSEVTILYVDVKPETKVSFAIGNEDASKFVIFPHHQDNNFWIEKQILTIDEVQWYANTFENY